MILKVFILNLILLIEKKIILNSEFSITDENFEKIGRIEQLDAIITDDDVLKAISFSSTDKTNVYKYILEEAVNKINLKIENKDLLKIELNEARYYTYILENVIKYTSKWLTEEVQQLTIQTNENKKNLQFRKKRNIAEFIYFTAGDYGVNLVMENKDTSFTSWIHKHKNEL